MPIQFIGMIRTDNVSEIHGSQTGSGEHAIDRDFVRDFARAHEDNGFDRILIGYHTSSPDGWAVAGYAASQTERLHMLVAHRPGFVAPTVAARHAVTHDHFYGGRFSFNIVTGGSDADQAKDGDFTGKDDRYRRTDEYLDVMKQVWYGDGPFTHKGDFYSVVDAWSEIRPTTADGIPIYFGGASAAAVPVAAKHADVYMLWGEPLAAVKERMDEAQALAPSGKKLAFSVSLRPIIAPTEAAAWEKAHDYLERIVAHKGGQRVAAQTSRGQAVGSQRLLDFAKQEEIYDKRLWMPIAAATGAGGNTTALVGTPEQVAESILDYYDLGVTSILIRGFEPLDDAIAYGKEIIPIVRQEIARRDEAARLHSAAD